MAIADFVVKHGTTVNEIATFSSTTDATSTTSAALTVAGGVGIVKNLIVGSTISTTQLTSTIATGTAPFVVASTTAVTNLKADTVVTNANLTGVITSVGNATSIASKTGTSTTIVTDTSPTLVTPTLGAATATSINGLTISTSTGTLTVANGKTFTVNNSITLSGTDSITTTLPSTSGTLALNNQTMYIGTSGLAINRASAALTLNGVSIDGNAATVTTNANLTGVITSVGNTTSITSKTGTSTTIVTDTSPTLITPTLGAATATSINGLTITSSTGILTIAAGKTFTLNATLTFNGTDNSAVAFGSGGSIGYTDKNKITDFMSIQSSDLSGKVTDKSGSGKLVFGTSPIITTSLTTDSTAFDLINTTATSVNFAKAATSISIGATGASNSTTINHSLVVTGDLTVNGTTTTVNSTTISVDDKNLELGSVTTPSDATAAGGGITLKGASDKTISWASTGDISSTNTGYWNLSDNINVSGSALGYYINNVSVLSTSSILGSSTTIGIGGSSSTITINGTIKLPNVGTSGFVKLGTGGQLSNDTSTYALTNQTLYLGTTSITLNRTSGTLTLASVNIDGSSGSTATVTSQGQVTNNTTGTGITAGLTHAQVYNNGYPTNYGNVMTMYGAGVSQLLLGWSGTTGASADNYIRSLRDSAVGTNGWSTWDKILTSANYNTYSPTLTGTGASGTWGISITGNAAGLSSSLAISSISATGTRDSTTYLAGDGTWKSTLLETTYTPTISGSGAISITIDFSTVNSTTILIPLTSGITGATITFTNLSSKAVSNTIFSFNVVLSHVTALSATTAIVWKFGSALNPKWTGNIIPPSTVAAAAVDIWTFFTYDSGASLIGSLSMADVRNA